MDKPLLVACLGNPGAKYESTWHNLGFMVADRLATQMNERFKAGRGEFVVASGFINKGKVVVIKPTTFMNLSGRAVVSALKFYDLEPENLLVVYDDLHLPLGQIRLRSEGSAGGHNGIKSLISCLSTQNFPRLRIGFKTGHSDQVLEQNRAALPDLVLAQIPKNLLPEVELSLSRACDCVEELLSVGIVKTMNRYN